LHNLPPAHLQAERSGVAQPCRGERVGASASRLGASRRPDADGDIALLWFVLCIELHDGKRYE
jgi:hypothetical protein